MTFRLLIEEVRQAISTSVVNLGYPMPDFSVSEPPREFGDITCNVAFQLGKLLKRRPSEIADEIIKKELSPYLDNNTQSLIASVESHQAGYINFRANFRRLSSVTLSMALQNPNTYGYFDVGKGKHLVIEHTSVNPNKGLHVGHVRNAVLGDSLYRIMKATNHRTTVLNYVDDSGLQVADIIIALKFAGFSSEPTDRMKFDQYCGELYVKINDVYEKDPLLAEKRKYVLREIEDGTSAIAKFALDITSRVLKAQLQTVWRMKVRYDLLNFESQIILSKLWTKTFELLREEGIVTFETEGKNKGCWVIKGHPNDDDDKVLVRSDGTATYLAKDIPYAAWKLGLVEDPFSYVQFDTQWDDSILWATTLKESDHKTIAIGDTNPNRNAQNSEASNGSEVNFPKFNAGEMVITIIDSRQGRLQRILTQVISRLDKNGEVGLGQYYHLGYEAVTLSSETAKTLGFDIGEKRSMHMSGRSGFYINADYILDILQSKAYEEVKSRNPTWSEENLSQTAEEIAVSAIRYNMIKQDLDKIITFDIKESLSLEGDTGPYLQYAYARSQRILEKSGVHQAVNSSSISASIPDARFAKLATGPELDLLREISRFDLVVEDAAKTLSPRSLARYAYTLATTFNVFYEKIPVLKGHDTDVIVARLTLVTVFGLTLRNAMALIGVSTLDRM